MEFETVIGLEVHVELSTKSKIYCTCSTEFGAEENTHICPVCTGLPGTLPALNKQVVEYCVKAGLALDCKINQYSRQDRKHYFYPDLPKAFQTSQFDLPLCQDGFVDLRVPEGDPLDGRANKPAYNKRVGITRIHIEEDAGKLIHGPGVTRLDCNRCGVPLIEIVTEPDFRSAGEVHAFDPPARRAALRERQQLPDGGRLHALRRQPFPAPLPRRALRHPDGNEKHRLLSATVRAIEYERIRQRKILEKGGAITQDTLRWDDERGVNYAMRSKEDAHDYFYFPEPDIMPIVVDDAWLKRIGDSLPELPHARRKRYVGGLGLPEYDADFLTGDKAVADLFDGCVALGAAPKTVSNWLMSDMARLTNDAGTGFDRLWFGAQGLFDLIALVENGTISRSAGSKVLEAMFAKDERRTPAELVKALGLAQVSDEGAILELCKTVIAANEKAAADYRAGKEKALTSLVGQVMKASRGKANPAIVNKLMVELLSAN